MGHHTGIRKSGRSLLAVTAGFHIIAPARLEAIQPSDVLAYSTGPLILRPHLDLTEKYDSNVLYRSKDVASDLITGVSPGLTFYLGKPELNFISLNYVLDSLFYAENDALNGNNHTIALQTQLQAPRVSLKGTDKIQFFSNKVLGAELNFQGGRNVADYETYSDVYRLTYSISEKTSVYLEGNYDAVDYDAKRIPNIFDYNNWNATFGFGYQAFPKTDFFGEIYYGQTATDPNTPAFAKPPHSDFVGGFAGTRGNFTPRLSGTVKAGYEVREFSNGTSSSGGIVVATTLEHKLTEKRSASLSYVRRSNISVQSGNSEYILDTLILQLQQQIGTRGKWVARFGGSYSSAAYQGNVFANRQDSLYTITGNLDYLIQLWLTAGVSYEFNKFKSTSTGVVGYDAHRITLRLAVGY